MIIYSCSKGKAIKKGGKDGWLGRKNKKSWESDHGTNSAGTKYRNSLSRYKNGLRKSDVRKKGEGISPDSFSILPYIHCKYNHVERDFKIDGCSSIVYLYCRRDVFIIF